MGKIGQNRLQRITRAGILASGAGTDAEAKMGRTILTVFLSSTGKDLDSYRAELRRQITVCGLH